ncbi:hypothetical protein [Streptomyces erythrochromogenes]
MPRSHEEVSTALDSFARFGNDHATEGALRSVLDNGRSIPAEDR